MQTGPDRLSARKPPPCESLGSSAPGARSARVSAMPRRGKKKGGHAGGEAADELPLKQALELSHGLLDEYEAALRTGASADCGSALIHERTGRSRERRYTKMQEKTGFCPADTLQGLMRVQKKIRIAAGQVRARREALLTSGSASPQLLLKCRELNLRTQELGALKRLRLGSLTTAAFGAGVLPSPSLSSVSEEESLEGAEEEEEEGAAALEAPGSAGVQEAPSLSLAPDSGPLVVAEVPVLPTPPGDVSAGAPKVPKRLGVKPNNTRADAPARTEASTPSQERREPASQLPSKWMLYGPPSSVAEAARPRVQVTGEREHRPRTNPLPPPPAAPPPPPNPIARPRPPASAVPLRGDGADDILLASDAPQGPHRSDDPHDPQSSGYEGQTRGGAQGSSTWHWPEAPLCCEPPCGLPPGLHLGWGTCCGQPSMPRGDCSYERAGGPIFQLGEHYWGDAPGSLRFVEAGEQLLYLAPTPCASRALVARQRTGARGTVPAELLRPLPFSDLGLPRTWCEGMLVALAADWRLPPWGAAPPRGPSVLRAGEIFVLLEDVSAGQTLVLVQSFPQESAPVFLQTEHLRLLDSTGNAA